MRAVVLAGVGDLQVREVPDAKLVDPGDAVVRVTTTAICGADLFPFHGHTPGFESGTVLGHEFVGVVEAVGPAVASLRPGDRVVSTSTISCGFCAHCRAGRPTQCPDRALFGYSGVYKRLDGGQAELVRVPVADRCLRLVPESIGDESAVFLADMLPTGYNAVKRADLAIGDVAVVVGCGTVGLMAVLFAQRIARTVIAIDAIAGRRALAGHFGAQAVTPEDARAAVDAATAGLGADGVVEAAGSAGALTAALTYVRGRGTVSVVGAHFDSDFPLNNALMFEREMTLRVSWGDPFNDRDRLLAFLETGDLDPTPVISHRFPLAEASEAYRLFDAREATKVLLTP
ncbi:MAG: alcohol dehydrogenase catalytic domain-containing protein [Chloroflexota bacterium]